MYLGIRTDAPLAEFYIYEGSTLRAEKTWQADRQLALGLLSQLEQFLSENAASFSDLSGLFVYRGPGSFTGLRIGITVMNTASYALSLPIVGEDGELWIEDSVRRLIKSENDEIVLPLYGSEARITQPRK